MQNGIVLITVSKEDMRDQMSLAESLLLGVASQLCLMVMTVFMATISLFPVPLNTASGSETQKPLTIVIIGELVTATVLISPLIFAFFCREMHQDGPVPKWVGKEWPILAGA